MDMIDAAVDSCIRRGLGFVGLAVATVMLSLSYDFVLSMRIGGDILAMAAGVMLVFAWRAPKRDHRRSEAWILLSGYSPDAAARLSRGEAQQLMAASVRRRMVWHAERVGAGAIAFWAVALLIALAKG